MNTGSDASNRSEAVEVRVSRKTTRMMARALGIVVGVMWLAMALQQIGLLHSEFGTGDRVMIAAAWGAAYVLYFAALGRKRVVLRHDRIEVTGALLPTRSISLDDIVARRTDTQVSRTHPPVLILKDGREAKLPSYLERNDAFLAWLRTLPYRQRRRSY